MLWAGALQHHTALGSCPWSDQWPLGRHCLFCRVRWNRASLPACPSQARRFTIAAVIRCCFGAVTGQKPVPPWLLSPSRPRCVCRCCVFFWVQCRHTQRSSADSFQLPGTMTSEQSSSVLWQAFFYDKAAKEDPVLKQQCMDCPVLSWVFKGVIYKPDH